MVDLVALAALSKTRKPGIFPLPLNPGHNSNVIVDSRPLELSAMDSTAVIEQISSIIAYEPLIPTSAAQIASNSAALHSLLNSILSHLEKVHGQVDELERKIADQDVQKLNSGMTLNKY